MMRRDEAGNWSRRYGANLVRLASGDPAAVAQVVSELAAREHDGSLSPGERRLLSKARYLGQLFGADRPASPQDRERAIDLLMAVFAGGSLDQRRYGERAARIRSVRTYAEVVAATADLPGGPLGWQPATGGPGG